MSAGTYNCSGLVIKDQQWREAHGNPKGDGILTTVRLLRDLGPLTLGAPYSGAQQAVPDRDGQQDSKKTDQNKGR